MKSRSFVSLAAVLLFGGVLSARQDPPPAPTPQKQQPPAFRSSVQVIEVDVRVFDKQGRFVTDLTRDEFEVIEEGASQRVDAVYLVDGPASLTAPAGADRVSGLPSTAPGATPAAPQTWVFVFDLNHLTPGSGFDRARKAVDDFIRDKFRDGDLAGILAGEKMVNNRLTSVRSELLEAVKQVKPRTNTRNRLVELTREWPRFLDEEEAIRVARNERDVLQRVIGRACSDDPQYCVRGDPEPMVRSKGLQFQQEIHRDSNLSLAAINALGSGLARIPGPKTVVLLSDGFVVLDIETTLRSVIGQMTRAGGRIYAIDVRGLNRAGNPGIIDQKEVEDSYSAVTKFDMLADGTNSLAIDTGGMMIRNENNLGRALTRIADDAGRYYVLAYRPANSNFDGKFRAIQVRVTRDGVRVRARRGYLALDPARMTIPQPVKSVTDAPVEAPEAVKRPESARPEVEPGAAPAMPVAATPPSTGATGASPTAPAPAGAVRLRPDSEERVKALSSRETTPDNDLAKSGWEAYQRGDVDSALSAFTRAAAQPNARPWVFYALGMTQAALGRGPDALASWERVRQAVPDFEPVYMDLADTYAQLSDLTRALAVLRDAQKRWPQSADVESAIGVIHVRRGALDDGIAALMRATELAPDDPLMHLNLGRAYHLRFVRDRRYVTSQRRWVAPEADRQKGVDAFQRCIALGGPYAQQAREALNVLEWSKEE